MILDRAGRRSPWGRKRYQLATAVIVAALLPFLVRLWLIQPGEPLSVIYQTLFLGVVAVCVSWWHYRSFRSYPGVEDSSYILSSLCGSFASIVIIILILRLDYSRGLLIGQFILSIGWFYILYFKLQRVYRLRIGIIPYGDLRTMPDFARVEWVSIETVDADIRSLDAITTDLRADLPDAWERRLADYALANIPVFHHKHLLESLTGRVELEHLSENSFGTLTPLSTYMAIKHGVDFLTAAVFLAVTAPFLVLIGVLVRLESEGPAIFRQQRIGYQGKPFQVLKFRTMRQASPNASSDRRDAMTQIDDARITPLGRFLRRTRLDELPQVVNILRGEMSWIGPRPEAEILSRWYEAELPFYRYRHIVRPGITGWAQVVQGHVAELDEVKEKLHYDFYYIKNYSASCDILILFRTIRTMLTGFGAK